MDLQQIPAVIQFELLDGTIVSAEQFEEYSDRFHFVDFHLLHSLAVYLRTISRTHTYGYIHVTESKMITLRTADCRMCREWSLN